MARMITVLIMVIGFLVAIPGSQLQAQELQPATQTACPNGPGWTPPSSSQGVQIECRISTTPASLGYLQYLPVDYVTSNARYPLIVFFHGQGQRGNGATELVRVTKDGPPKLIKQGKQFPAIVISPQLPSKQGGWWSAISTPFVDYILNHYRVDMKRIYVTGLSLGGGGAWIYAKNHPNIVAAIVPVCGTEGSAGYEVLRGLPIWAFHNERDTVVAYGKTTSKLKIITGINPEPTRPRDNQLPGYTAGFDGARWNWRLGEAAPPAQENPFLTTYESEAHDAWTAAYDNQEMWAWLFQQSRPTQH